MIKFHNTLLAGAASAALFASGANATDFNIQSGDLGSALNAYMAQSGVVLIVSGDAVKGIKTRGVKGDLAPDAALTRLLSGTGFLAQPNSGVIAIVREGRSSEATSVQLQPMQLAQAAPARATVETVTVTSSKLGGGDVQSIPIAITALSQEQLTATQTAGGPDLVKQVPNLTFTKTNFSGYSIQIRGIGTQAISVTTDPAVAVALNDIPFIRNHFFEQEFFDLSQAEVLRGPQGTLYGRNATAGVVNVITAKPTDQFEAMASADIGNYKNRRFEGMINLPIVDDRFDIRLAGEWTKRDGYSFNSITNQPIDGRDLWSGRLSIGIKPSSDVQINFVWEHFQEDDDRLRSSKQLCKTDNGPSSVLGTPVPPNGSQLDYGGALDPAGYLSQGCVADSLYDKGNPSQGDYGSFGVPDGYALPYIKAAKLTEIVNPTLNPYTSPFQSTDLRVIESTVDPSYKAKNDTLELNVDYAITPTLTFTSQTGYNQDFLFSTEDYNRYNTSPGMFLCNGQPCHGGAYSNIIDTNGVFCDPQVGCADRIVAVDLSDEHSWQLSQEFRLASNFSGPLNFSIGGNYMHYETEENYYVFINALTLYASSSALPSVIPWVPGVSDNNQCLAYLGYGYQYRTITEEANSTPSVNQCNYIDPNPISSLNNRGHNYFLSQNPYVLSSYAGFGEVYYQIFSDLKFIGGLRWTDDQKHFTDIPSEVVTDGWGYPSSGVVDQEWTKWTGRFAANWTPKFDFTDQTLVYGSVARGYKAGGANPPGAILFGNFTGNHVTNGAGGNSNIPIHPLTFKPEFVTAFELGTKNTLMDGGLTLNGDVFFYNYTGYQISRIVDRTAINDNFNAKVKGAELEASWEPLPGLKFNFAGGYEDTRVDNGQSSVDLIDRADTAEHPDWMVVRPFPTQASNCILPTYVVSALLQSGNGIGLAVACGAAYNAGLDPATVLPYVANPTQTAPYFSGNEGTPYIPPGYPGFNPATAPNGGAGWSKDLSGNELPNAPHFTTSLSAEYSLPVSDEWAATLHGDLYWQSQSWARIFNDRPYDKIRGYSNVNLALILTSVSGWQVMGYLKNVFDTTSISGDFLNSDDTGLTTNIFLTDPRLFGVRVTKNW